MKVKYRFTFETKDKICLFSCIAPDKARALVELQINCEKYGDKVNDYILTDIYKITVNYPAFMEAEGIE